MWGLEALPRLNGIFAFGLWDRESRALLLARDHLGVKPLLYQQDASGVRFSSELKPLLEPFRMREYGQAMLEALLGSAQ